MAKNAEILSSIKILTADPDNAELIGTVYYSRLDKVFRKGERLYGNWCVSLENACNDSSNNKYLLIKDVENPEKMKSCKGGFTVIKVDYKKGP